MNKKITKQYGDCEVTLSFVKNNSEAIGRVMWLLIESYCERTSLKIEQESNSGKKIS